MRITSLAVMAGLAVSMNAMAGRASAQEAPVPVPSLAPAPAPATVNWTPAVSDPARTTAGAAIPSFSQLFRSVGSDFRHLPSRENALLLAIGAGIAGVSSPVDRDVSEDWTRPGPADKILAGGAIAGSSYLHVGAAFAVYAVGRGTHNTRVGQFGADLARAQILAQSTTFAIKFAANRTRPNGEVRSFPSGHTSSMFATAVVVQQHFGWKAGIPAFAGAAYVGASRIQDNKHYLSDVAFGAALGIIAGRTATVGTRSVRFALTPITGPNGGMGIGLTRVK